MVRFVYRFEGVLAEARRVAFAAGRARTASRLRRDAAERQAELAVETRRSVRASMPVTASILADLERWSAAATHRLAVAHDRLSRCERDLRTATATEALARRRAGAFERGRARAYAAHVRARALHDERELDDANAALRANAMLALEEAES